VRDGVGGAEVVTTTMVSVGIASVPVTLSCLAVWKGSEGIRKLHDTDRNIMAHRTNANNLRSQEKYAGLSIENSSLLDTTPLYTVAM
jgi:hypothetical protein